MSVIIQASYTDVNFIAGHESPGGRAVSRAYRCPAGVITIGHGFTMGSRVFAAYWKTKHGRALRMGDTIEQREADEILKRILDEEYGKAVAREVKPRKQNHFGAATSLTYNCGTGALKWNWARALGNGDIKDAAARMRTTAVTANGRRLAGLVRRRSEEARLLESGIYSAMGPGKQPTAVSQTKEEVREYQKQLIALGYDVGAADGLIGHKTIAAVKDFQTDNGLKADGVVGPATRATLIRALDAKRGKQAATGAGGAGAAAGGQEALVQPTTEALTSAVLWGLGALAVVAVAIIILKYRGVLTGNRVPT